jgi:hypothetical protein
MLRTAIACVAALAASTLMAAAPALEVVKTIVSQSDGGAPLPPGFVHVTGEVLFLTFSVNGFQKDASDKVRVAYTVDTLDPKGVKTTETVANEVVAELAPQDKEWAPKVRMEVTLPPLAHSGAYRVVIKVKDLVGKTEAEKTVPIEVQGRMVDPSPTLTVRNFRFFRGEDDTEPLAKPIYRAGDPVWARFDIIGYQYGKGNAIDVVYGVSVNTMSGKVLWSQAEAAVERSQSFYPKPWVPGAMSITLGKDFKPGDYTIGVQVKDALGNQTFEEKYVFTVE